MQSAASGLNPYNPSGGVVSYGLSGTMIVPVSNKASLTFIGSYNRLASDAANSSLVTERGAPDQAFFGIISAYTFK